MSSNRDRSASRSGAAPPTPDDVGDTIRLSVNLAPAVADTLKGYSRRKGVSVTEAVRRAISLLAYVDAAQDRGASLNVAENGKLKEVQFLV